MLRSQRAIAIYVLLMAALQLTLYITMLLRKSSSGFFYFDPRLGLYFIESSMRAPEPPPPGLLAWISSIALGWIGYGMLRQSLRLRSYIWFEVICCVPTLLFFAVIALANLSPAHGFSVGELIVPVPIFLLFSVVPLYSAFKVNRATH